MHHSHLLATHTAHARTLTKPFVFEQFFPPFHYQDGSTLGLLHLVKPVAGVSERHGHAGAHVAAGTVALGQAGGRPLPLQWGQTCLDRLAKQQHGFGQRVAEEFNEICFSFFI